MSYSGKNEFANAKYEIGGVRSSALRTPNVKYAFHGACQVASMSV